MRALGLGLVVASLAFSTGGVSVRPAAAQAPAVAATEVPAAAASPVIEYPPAPAPAAPNTCQIRSAAPIVVQFERNPFSTDDYVPLNTRGYNYPASDDAPERFGASSAGAPQPRH